MASKGSSPRAADGKLAWSQTHPRRARSSIPIPSFPTGVRIGVSGTRSSSCASASTGESLGRHTLGRYSKWFTLAAARKKARVLLTDIEVQGGSGSALSEAAQASARRPHGSRHVA